MYTGTARILLAAALASSALAQEIPTILEVDVENYVAYTGDTTDPARVAKSPGPVTPVAPANFFSNVILADVTRLNGVAAKGVMVLRTQTLLLNPAPGPSAAIADVNRVAAAEFSWEFLTAEGTPIGSIFAAGLSGGTPAPGSPLTATGGNVTITGGTGAFLGVRGTINSVENTARSTSQAEDPSARRRNGGGRGHFVLQIYPMARPEVIVDGNGPQVFHGDDTLVTADAPAHAGEALSLNARGLGPTRPGVNAGDAFPAEPAALVNSPLEVLVNGKPTSPSTQMGLAGSINVYRIVFQVPAGTEGDSATIQLRAAWIAGSPVSIPVQ